MASKFRNSGQTCVCANRLFVHTSVHDAFVNKLHSAMSAQLVVGDGLAPETTQGPLINQAAVDKVDALVQAAVDAGATVVMGGTRPSKGSNFYTPTLLTSVTDDMSVASSEIFGPGTCVFAHWFLV